MVKRSFSAIKIKITGLVQGVGFRPFIYVLAKKYGINGWVENNNEGVLIHAEAESGFLDDFISAIVKNAPDASQIHSLNTEISEIENFTDFRINKSRDLSDDVTEICPDISVCKNCLDDLKTQKHRVNYPFINCTNCGPRFTIIHDLPYDRKMTSMHEFIMCEKCETEYRDISDRRFHAQPVACNHCGPVCLLEYHNGLTETEIDKITSETSRIIESGGIVGLKSFGGYNLVCDALNEDAVKKLRTSKIREGKPFAVMFRNSETIKNFAWVNAIEEEQLQSWRRPIIILKAKKPLAFSVSNGFSTIGCMLPCLPFHYLLFEKLKIDAIVMTSGNISEEPILISDIEARKTLLPVSDALISYNREIVNRTDDSVMLVVNDMPRLIRRSRGYVPNPVRTSVNLDSIFAAGAELVNCFCIGKRNQAILSQHIGDLKNIETLEFYEESFDRFCKMFRFKPTIAVADLHPDYLSTRFAQSLEIPVIRVQHHHAHIASVMAEQNIENHVIGFSFDGLGLGDDGNIWGAEVLICDSASYNRFLHFDYIPMPGGDKASKEPWRMGISSLFKYFGNEIFSLQIPLIQKKRPDDISLLVSSIQKGINAPLASSCGRLFDAVAAITGVCSDATFHAEAPMRLEDLIDNAVSECYDFEISDVISFEKMFFEIVDDLGKKTPLTRISSKFHNTLVSVIFESAIKARKETGIDTIVLSGGSFQNKYLLGKTEQKLKENRFKVFANSFVPSNDGGISLGQIFIAANKR